MRESDQNVTIFNPIQREKIRAWNEFADQKSFTAPATIQEWSKRLVRNVEYYQANYIITFLILMLYCILTSPLLLIALAVSATGRKYTVLKQKKMSYPFVDLDQSEKSLLF